MATSKTRKLLHGARSVVAEDQPSFIEEHPRHGKHHDDGRKVVDLDRVGAIAPDADADSPGEPRRRRG